MANSEIMERMEEQLVRFKYKCEKSGLTFAADKIPPMRKELAEKMVKEGRKMKCEACGDMHELYAEA
jgi:hypothetical protein